MGIVTAVITYIHHYRWPMFECERYIFYRATNNTHRERDNEHQYVVSSNQRSPSLASEPMECLFSSLSLSRFSSSSSPELILLFLLCVCLSKRNVGRLHERVFIYVSINLCFVSFIHFGQHSVEIHSSRFHLRLSPTHSHFSITQIQIDRHGSLRK